MSLTLKSFKRSSLVAYKFFISSKVIANVKINKTRTRKKQYAPRIIQSGGHNDVFDRQKPQIQLL